jgi:hypothetical protein
MFLTNVGTNVDLPETKYTFQIVIKREVWHRSKLFTNVFASKHQDIAMPLPYPGTVDMLLRKITLSSLLSSTNTHT